MSDCPDSGLLRGYQRGIADGLGGARWTSWWVVLLGISLSTGGVALAEHEVDHRFTVEGFVCGADGKPLDNLEVMVKDTRIPLGKTTYTDSDGYYAVTLHLHNENQGDPILVAAGDREERVTARFDAKDVKSERKIAVHFGSGCEQEHRGAPRWVYYSLVGLGLAGVAVVAGVKMMRKQRRPGKRGKGQRKS